MRKIHKNRQGFTLIEMVLVIAICVILAMVIWFNVADYMAKAKSATSKMESHQQEIDYVTAQIEGEIGS